MVCSNLTSLEGSGVPFTISCVNCFRCFIIARILEEDNFSGWDKALLVIFNASARGSLATEIGGDAGSLVSSMIGFEAFSVASVLAMASLEVVGVALC